MVVLVVGNHVANAEYSIDTLGVHRLAGAVFDAAVHASIEHIGLVGLDHTAILFIVVLFYSLIVVVVVVVVLFIVVVVVVVVVAIDCVALLVLADVLELVVAFGERFLAARLARLHHVLAARSVRIVVVVVVVAAVAFCSLAAVYIPHVLHGLVAHRARVQQARRRDLIVLLVDGDAQVLDEARLHVVQQLVEAHGRAEARIEVALRQQVEAHARHPGSRRVAHARVLEVERLLDVDLVEAVPEESAREARLERLGVLDTAVEHGHAHRRRLDARARHHEDLAQTGYTKRDVHVSAAGEVERVECHLCGRLADRLRRQNAHRVARRDARLERLEVDEVAELGLVKNRVRLKPTLKNKHK